MGVRPTEPGFIKHFKTNQDPLEKFDVDGVWMDYLQWHAQFENLNVSCRKPALQ